MYNMLDTFGQAGHSTGACVTVPSAQSYTVVALK